MKFFKLTKMKRIMVLVATLTAAILAITLGTLFYVSKNVKKSVEYGGGAEYLVQINARGDNADQIATDVAQSIYERIDPLGVREADAQAEKSGNNQANVRVTVPGNLSQADMKAVERLITEQPQLILTDIYGNPLFNSRGEFNKLLKPTTNSFVGTLERPTNDPLDFYRYEFTIDNNLKPIPSKVPIASGGASAYLRQDGSRLVKIKLNSDSAAIEWTNATKYISSITDAKNRVIQAWLNPHVFINEVKTFFSGQGMVPSWADVWQNSGRTINGLAHYVVGNTAADSSYLMNHIARAADYLISSAAVSGPLSGREFEIEGNFDAESARSLARKINYGISDYSLKTLYSRNIDATYGNEAFNKAVIAGIVVFGIIALILIFNYGLLGALSTVSIGLFIFMTLAMFTVMHGQYSPASIAALIIGIGMSVDANIITFERLKAEMYAGASLKKAFTTSNRKSFSTIFDSNITTMIVAVVLFYFGTRSIIGLSVTLIISIVFTLLIMLLLTRLTSTMLVKSGAFEKRKWLVGLKPKLDPAAQKQINKIDFIKNSKWFSMSSGIIMLAGLVVFAIFAGIHHSAVSGLALSQDFTGGTSISGETLNKVPLDDATRDLISKQLVGFDISWSDHAFSAKSTMALEDDVKKLIITNLTSLQMSGADVFDDKALQISLTTSDVASQLVKDAAMAIGIAMAGIVAYTLLRFKWTYSLAAIIALVHDALIVLAIFAIARIEISPIFIAAVLSVVGYSINDTIVTFDRLREKMVNHIGNLEKDSIINLANGAVRETLKRSLWTSFTTLVAIVVLMGFGNATKFEFNIAMFIGLISGTYSSIFIATYLWTKLETFRQKRIQLRVKKQFWKTDGIEEQTVLGINDFRV